MSSEKWSEERRTQEENEAKRTERNLKEMISEGEERKRVREREDAKWGRRETKRRRCKRR